MENEPTSSSSGEEIVSSEESVSESQPDNTPSPQPSIGVDLKMDLKKAAKKKAVVLADGDSVDLKRAAKKKAVVAEDGDLKRDKKKPAEGDGGRPKKRRVVLAVAAPKADIAGQKKVLIERLWSQENEIELIQGVINYVEEKGRDPFAYVNDFHEFVKKSLHVDVTDKQVLAKLRKLKHKYKNNVAKLENDGKVRSFSNPHERKLYELSKNLWVSETAKVKGEVEVLGLQVTDEGIMNKGLELLSGPRKVEMEEKWKNLKVQQLEHFLKKVDILKEQGEVVLNAIKKSGGK